MDKAAKRRPAHKTKNAAGQQGKVARLKQGSERVSGAGASGELDCKSRDRPKQGRRGFLRCAR
ncbi:hypothetical protein MPLA_1400012 [Mesorhizobium sp. ORS 3359]|nr:hypothetical protein MPLA_1400012 [Mesorhizobium sp. ORS 3359]